MRLPIMDKGLGTKALFAFIRAVSREPVLDVIKLVKYRPEFYLHRTMPFNDAWRLGAQRVNHEAMRGPSAWSVGDRELMAALVAKSNGCEGGTRAHDAVAAGAHRYGSKVSVVLTDPDPGTIEEPLRATLRMLCKLTREQAVDADDMRAVLAAGASHEQIEDALAVCLAFNMPAQLADDFGFSLASPKAFDTAPRVEPSACARRRKGRPPSMGKAGTGRSY